MPFCAVNVIKKVGWTLENTQYCDMTWHDMTYGVLRPHPPLMIWQTGIIIPGNEGVETIQLWTTRTILWEECCRIAWIRHLGIGWAKHILLDTNTGWLVWLLLYAHRHWSILGATGHIILTPANQLIEEYNSEPPEQSCLLKWTEKLASLCFGPSGDRTPYLLIRSHSLLSIAPQARAVLSHRERKIQTWSVSAIVKGEWSVANKSTGWTGLRKRACPSLFAAVIIR
jgi:hypothetical protein